MTPLRAAAATALLLAVVVPSAFAADRVEPCPADEPLGAHVEVRFALKSLGYTRDGRADLWFRLFPMASIGWKYDLAAPWTAREIAWKAEAAACEDQPGDDATHACPPVRARGFASVGPGGEIGYATFLPIKPEITILIPPSILSAADAPLTWVRNDGSASGTSGTAGTLVDKIDIGPREGNALAVNGTPCATEFLPRCAQEADRFAVVPFAGTGTRTIEFTSDSSTREKIRWEACCGCGEPPREEFEGENAPCGGDDQQRGQLEVAVALASALRADLRPRLERYEHHRRQAAAYASDFELVSNSCAGWDAAIALMTLLTGGPNAPAGAQAATQLLGMLQKIAAGDPAVILTAGDDLAIDLLGVGSFNMGTLWDSASALYGAALNAQNAGSIESMRKRLDECAKVGLVSDLVYNDAKRHLQHMESAYAELPAIHELSTRIQQADAEVFNKWHAWHKACVENAVCEGSDPGECVPRPPQ